jgi:hypothetical protein
MNKERLDLSGFQYLELKNGRGRDNSMFLCEGEMRPSTYTGT